MYQDDYFKQHTWIWDGKPHWAYNTDHVKYLTSREAIEWTPNTISCDVAINGNTATATLRSVTPNFKEYEMKEGAGSEWVKCDSVVSIALNKDRLEYAFRAVNAANVAGPQYQVAFAKK